MTLSRTQTHGSRKPKRGRSSAVRPLWLGGCGVIAAAALIWWGWSAWSAGGRYAAEAGANRTGEQAAAVSGAARPAASPGAKAAESAGSLPSSAQAQPEGGSSGSTGAAKQASGGAPGSSAPAAVNAPSKEPPAAPANGGPQAASPVDGPTVKLAVTGDVMWASTVSQVLGREGYDYPYRLVKEPLQQADIALANLETPITERGEEQEKEYVYRSSPLGLPAFRDAGFDVVNLANNHILDYGEQGLLDTLDELDRQKIAHIGAGRQVKDAFEPVIIEKNGIKTAFLGFSKVVPTASWKAGPNHPGVADTYSTKLPVASIREAKQKADLVVVMTHWGKEQTDKPEKYQVDMAHQYIDAGADLVVASHPHVLQGLETYKGKWIAYSLGNFVFTMNPKAETWESLILQAECSRQGACAVKLVPVLTKLANPTPMDTEEGAALFRKLTSLSTNAEVLPDGTVRGKTNTK